AEVQVLGRDGQVLATQERGDLRRQASERLTLSVDQTPRVGHVAGFGAIRLLCGGRHDVLLGLAVSVVHVRALPRSRVLDCRHERANDQYSIRTRLSPAAGAFGPAARRSALASAVANSSGVQCPSPTHSPWPTMPRPTFFK